MKRSRFYFLFPIFYFLVIGGVLMLGFTLLGGGIEEAYACHSGINVCDDPLSAVTDVPDSSTDYIWTCTGAAGTGGGTLTCTVPIPSPPPPPPISQGGTVVHKAKLDGTDWSGAMMIGASATPGGAVPPTSVTVPLTSLGLAAGTYTVYYSSGGPSNATFNSITPSATQTLASGGTITFTYNFTSISTPTLGSFSITSVEPQPSTATQCPNPTEVKVTWTASSNAASYKVLHCINQGCTQGAEVGTVTAPTTNFIHTTASNSGYNNYQIKAIDATGATKLSDNTKGVTPYICAVTPSSFCNTNGTAYNKIQWTGSQFGTTGAGTSVSSFDVKFCTGSSSCTPSTIVASGLAGTANSYSHGFTDDVFQDGTLPLNTLYRYQVTANSSGIATLLNIAQVTTVSSCAAPPPPPPPPSTTGTVEVRGIVNDVETPLTVSYTVSGPTVRTGSAAPATFSGMNTGAYSLTSITGYPSNYLFDSWDCDQANCTLTGGGTLFLRMRFHTTVVSSCDSNAVGTNQLIGCLWDGTNFTTSGGGAPSGTILSSPVPDSATAFDYNWGSGSPNATTVGNDTYSAKWKGNFTFKAGGTYTFTVGSDDGVRVKINGEQITSESDWVGRAYLEKTYQKIFSSQITALVEVEYFEDSGQAQVNVRWTFTPTGAICGNNIVESGEQCEPPNTSSCSSTCQFIATIPPPTITNLRCESNASKATINWTNVAGKSGSGYWVDISTNSSFTPFWNKFISDPNTISTTAPDGFNGLSALTGGTTYHVRVYYIQSGEHSPPASFAAQSCGTTPPPPPPGVGGPPICDGQWRPIEPAVHGKSIVGVFVPPGKNTQAANSIATVARGDNDCLYYNWHTFTSGTWTGWQPVYPEAHGCGVTSAPHAYVGDALDIQVQGGDGNFWHTINWNGGWQTWFQDAGAAPYGTPTSFDCSAQGCTGGTWAFRAGSNLEYQCGSAGGSPPPPPPGSITGYCLASPDPVGVNAPVFWSALSITGGTGSYSYTWSGSDSLFGSDSNTIGWVYATTGTKTAQVVVTDSAGSAQLLTCDPLDVQAGGGDDDDDGGGGGGGGGSPPPPPDCSNECSPSGATQCSGANEQTCGNSDGDVCLEWGSPIACESGFSCLEDSCSPVPPISPENFIIADPVACNLLTFSWTDPNSPPADSFVVTCNGIPVTPPGFNGTSYTWPGATGSTPQQPSTYDCSVVAIRNGQSSPSAFPPPNQRPVTMPVCPDFGFTSFDLGEGEKLKVILTTSGVAKDTNKVTLEISDAGTTFEGSVLLTFEGESDAISAFTVAPHFGSAGSATATLTLGTQSTVATDFWVTVSGQHPDGIGAYTGSVTVKGHAASLNTSHTIAIPLEIEVVSPGFQEI